jgi:hypothetical protein
VSSFVALLPSDGPLRPNSSLGQPKVPYARSKVETERIARDLQQDGAPVVITRPGMVWRPHDPHLGETAILARDILRGRVSIRIPGGVPVVDVRDVAAVHAAITEGGRGPRTYLATGEFVPFARLFELMRATTGRRLPAAPAAPARVLLAGGAVANAVQRVLPFRLPVHHEGPWTVIIRPARRRLEHAGGARRHVPAARGGDRRHSALAVRGRVHQRPAGGVRRRPMTGPTRPPLPFRLLTAAASLVLPTAVLYPLREIAPAVARRPVPARGAAGLEPVAAGAEVAAGVGAMAACSTCRGTGRWSAPRGQQVFSLPARKESTVGNRA